MRRTMLVVGLYVAVIGAEFVFGAAPGRADGMDAAVAEVPPAGPTAVVFDGFGLDSFEGEGSIASALQGLAAADSGSGILPGVPVNVLVKGPNGRTAGTNDPLAAELKSRFDGVSLSAGMQADPTMIEEGPAKWVGGLGFSNDHALGKDMLELRTSLGRGQQVGVLGLDVGPRIERRLRGGTMFFVDGKAQAQARRSPETGGWALPGLADQNLGGPGSVGVAASTGLVR
jgi:hypothetical protein